MYTNHDKFLAALALARANNDATAMNMAIEAIAAGKEANESWAYSYDIGHGNCKPANRIKEHCFLNPHTDDIRNWEWTKMCFDAYLRSKVYGEDWHALYSILHMEDRRSAASAYAKYLSTVIPAPDRISGVYMMFQRDMGEGFCVKIGASDDCAARQSQYFTHNPFAIKGECMPCDNPKEMEKRFHEWFRMMGYENIKTSREWFAIDKGLYKALKNDGFDAIMCQWEE